jgi:hypothetical protein
MAHMYEFDYYRNVNPQNRFMCRQIAIAMSKVKFRINENVYMLDDNATTTID